MSHEPTYSVDQVAEMCDRSLPWVRATALAKDLGHMEGRQRRFTRSAARAMQRLADPEEARGRPASV